MLEPAGLDERNLSSTLGRMMKGGVDYADLYFQVSRHESWTLEDGIIRDGSFSLDQGVGVRATSGETTGFAYSDELVMPALERGAGHCAPGTGQKCAGLESQSCRAVVLGA